MSSPPATHTRAGPSFVCKSTSSGDGVAHIRLHGELDLATAVEVRRSLGAELGVALDAVVDLRGLHFMDTAGVHTLVDATAAARRVSRRVLLMSGPPQVNAVFDLTGTAGDVRFADRPVRAA